MNAGKISLAELRTKTDRELLLLVRSEIARSLLLAGSDSKVQAEEEYAKARDLFAVAGGTAAERAELERGLNEVRTKLDRCRHAAASSGQAWS